MKAWWGKRRKGTQFHWALNQPLLCWTCAEGDGCGELFDSTHCACLVKASLCPPETQPPGSIQYSCIVPRAGLWAPVLPAPKTGYMSHHRLGYSMLLRAVEDVALPAAGEGKASCWEVSLCSRRSLSCLRSVLVPLLAGFRGCALFHPCCLLLGLEPLLAFFCCLVLPLHPHGARDREKGRVNCWSHGALTVASTGRALFHLLDNGDGEAGSMEVACRMLKHNSFSFTEQEN